MVGLRAKFVVGDEMAFGNFVCHNSRLQTALPGAVWRYAGVPNGVRATPFYHIDNEPNNGWSKHHYPTYINPLYQSEEAKQQLITDYGGEDTQGYVTQVLGLWGEELVSSFPPGSIAVHDLPYFIKTVMPFQNESELEEIPLRVSLPTVRCERFALGMDYGFSPDPSEIVGAYTKGENIWKEYFRVHLARVAQPHQVAIIL